MKELKYNFFPGAKIASGGGYLKLDNLETIFARYFKNTSIGGILWNLKQ